MPFCVDVLFSQFFRVEDSLLLRGVLSWRPVGVLVFALLAQPCFELSQKDTQAFVCVQVYSNQKVLSHL